MILLTLIILFGIMYLAINKEDLNYFNDLQKNFNKRKKYFEFADAEFLMTLLARVAKANGHVSREEADYVSSMLDQTCDELGSQRYRDTLKNIYNTQKNETSSVFNIAIEYKFKRRLSQNECVSVVIYLLNLAYADGKFDIGERILIAEVCDGFDLPQFQRDDLFSRFESEFASRKKRSEFTQNSTKKDPYDVLELPKTATLSEIKARHRKLARKYHPDFLGGNADKSVVADATKKMQEINEAYEELKSRLQK